MPSSAWAASGRDRAAARRAKRIRPPESSGETRSLPAPRLADRDRPARLGPGRKGGGIMRALLMACLLPAAFVSTARAQSPDDARSEEHTSELQSRENLVCRLLLEK